MNTAVHSFIHQREGLTLFFCRSERIYLIASPPFMRLQAAPPAQPTTASVGRSEVRAGRAAFNQ